MKFYSEKLDKMFDSEKDLVTAETAAEDAALKKKEAAEAKKAEAKVVEDAFKACNAARAEYNKEVLAAKKQYTEELKKIRATLDTKLDKASKKLDEAEVAYDNALKEFTAKHPEGYHMTLKDGDNVITLYHNNKDFNVNSALKIFDLVDTFFGI